MSDTEKLEGGRRVLQKTSKVVKSIVMVVTFFMTVMLSSNLKAFAAEQDDEMLAMVNPITSMTLVDAKTSYQYSQEEVLAVMQVVYGEASGESIKGKTAVAAVVLNRFFGVNNWPHDNIVNVTNQSGQFHRVNKSFEWIAANYPDIVFAVAYAMQGYDPTGEYFPAGAEYFHADWKRGVLGETSIVTRNSGSVMMIIDHQAYYYDYK